MLSISRSRVLEIIDDYDKDMPISEICKKYRHDFITVKRALGTKYSDGQMKDRFKRLCALRKVGSQNPMFGKTGKDHHNFVEVQETHSGYLRTRNVPEWYTGPNQDGRVYLHRLKYCEYYGLSDLPENTVVHHIDENKQNNSKDNLELLTISEHMTHHGFERSRKEQRLSREGVQGSALEAPDTFIGDDIV